MDLPPYNHKEAIETVALLAEEKLRTSQNDSAESLGMMRGLVSESYPTYSTDHELQASFVRGFYAAKKILKGAIP